MERFTTEYLLSSAWENMRTGYILRQLDLSRFYFHRHPLYRRWRSEAYRAPLAYIAQEIPDKINIIIPWMLLILPTGALMVGLIGGASAFSTLIALVGFFMLGIGLFVAALGTMLTIGLVTKALGEEHRAGRWDLLMLMPYDRASVVVMRAASMLHPYRPLISMLDLIQTGVAMLLALYINGQADTFDNNLVGICTAFWLPTLFILTWERRQDYALAVGVGVLLGMNDKPHNSLSMALGSGVVSLGLRLIFGLLAVGLAPNANGFGVLLPTVLAGPGMLFMMGVTPIISAALLIVYYLGREALIHVIWRRALGQVWG